MAVPARRVSKTRKRLRNSHKKIDAATITKCSNCGAEIVPHRACPECGYYKGKKAVAMKTDAE